MSKKTMCATKRMSDSWMISNYKKFAINALRKIVGDEDKCNLAIKRDLEKGP